MSKWFRFLAENFEFIGVKVIKGVDGECSKIFVNLSFRAILRTKSEGSLF
jgi:hypothetical protein